jgi:putative acetyltransferase
VLCRRITIRPGSPQDAEAIAILHETAFGRDDEARLAIALIEDSAPTISLVAECEGQIAGHVLFSALDAPVPCIALAPLAVAPQYREMQVGSTLVREGLRMAAEQGYRAAFVLGDNAYYERFGFRSHLADPFDAPWQGRHFMAMELQDGALAGQGGELRYPPQFYGSDY